MTQTSAPASAEAVEWRPTFGNVVQSEWIKARSLRTSRRWGGAALVVGVGLGVLFAASLPIGPRLDLDSQRANEVITLTVGIGFLQLLAGVVGVLTITGEYTSRSIDSTFVAVPRRWTVLLAKLVVLIAVNLCIGVAVLVLTAALTAPILSARGVSLHLADPMVFGPVFGGQLYLALIAAFSFFVGAIIRVSAGSITVALGMMLLVPTLVSQLGAVPDASWLRNILGFLPSSVGERLYAYVPSTGYLVTGGAAIGVPLTTAQAVLVLFAWVTALAVVTFGLLRVRDV